MLNALLTNPDAGLISGDILKAYGSNGVLQVNPLASDYSLTPVHDMDILMQIRNASYIPIVMNSGSTARYSAAEIYNAVHKTLNINQI